MNGKSIPLTMRIAIGLLGAGVCWGDGGALLFQGQARGRVVSVFTSPAALTIGPVEVAVLIEAAGGSPVVGEPVVIVLSDPHQPGIQISKAAIWGDSGNAAMASARMNLPHAGQWTLRVRYSGSEVSQAVRVTEGRARFWDHWRAWVFVPVLLSLFLWHQWLTKGAKQALGTRLS